MGYANSYKDCSEEISFTKLETCNKPMIAYSSAPKKESKVALGMRDFSVVVCKKLQSKGRTTFSEITDEITKEFSAAHFNGSAVSFDKVNPPSFQFDAKNILRRVYDTVNILMAMDIITKDKKGIQWKGLPATCAKIMEEAKVRHAKLMNIIGKKASYLKELEEQLAGLQNLKLRNQQSLNSRRVHSGTSQHAEVEIEISEEMNLVHIDFNNTPFSLHDNASILKLLGSYQFSESRDVPQLSSDSTPAFTESCS